MPAFSRATYTSSLVELGLTPRRPWACPSSTFQPAREFQPLRGCRRVFTPPGGTQTVQVSDLARSALAELSTQLWLDALKEERVVHVPAWRRHFDAFAGIAMSTLRVARGGGACARKHWCGGSHEERT